MNATEEKNGTPSSLARIEYFYLNYGVLLKMKIGVLGFGPDKGQKGQKPKFGTGTHYGTQCARSGPQSEFKTETN